MITGMPRIAIAVEDFEETVRTFRDKLGMPVIDISDTSVEKLGAKLAMCVPEGGSNIEIMSPAVPEAPLSQSLRRFLDRRGQGLFALMLEAVDPNDEAKTLIKRGLNVLPLMEGAGGRDIHPKSTHGVLIRVYPVDSYQGKRTDQDYDSDSPGLSGISRVIIAVNDMDHAVSVYGYKLGMEIAEPSVDDQRGILSTICTPPTGGKIELVCVEDETRPFAKSIMEFLVSNQEGMYGLVMQSNNLEATQKILSSRGLKFNSSVNSPDAVEIERCATFGALIRIEAA